jgi:putative intracellular protease/amidase
LVLCALSAARLGAASDAPYTKNVAILLYDGVEVLDFSGPAEVFQAASQYGANGSEEAFHVYTVSRHAAPVLSQGFLHVTPDFAIEDSPKADILVLPGGGAGVVTSDSAWLDWVQSSGRNADHVLTVCTGAFVAGKAGLLDGLEATTWYKAVPKLGAEFPKVKAVPGRRFIDSGKVITTAGVSAGIDGALHLVARLLGRQVAERTAEYMEYKWAPESYLSTAYTYLNPRLDEHGRALQQASILAGEGNEDAAISAYRSLVARDKNDAAAWLGLGRALHRLKRYREAIAAHLEASKGHGQRGLAFYNLACEYALTGDRDKAIDAVAKAIDAGFRAKGLFLADDDLATVRADPRFKALMDAL